MYLFLVSLLFLQPGKPEIKNPFVHRVDRPAGDACGENGDSGDRFRSWKTYDGYLLAAIRSGKEAGQIKVTFTADGCEAAEVMLTVDTGKKE